MMIMSLGRDKQEAERKQMLPQLKNRRSVANIATSRRTEFDSGRITGAITKKSIVIDVTNVTIRRIECVN